MTCDISFGLWCQTAVQENRRNFNMNSSFGSLCQRRWGNFCFQYLVKEQKLTQMQFSPKDPSRPAFHMVLTVHNMCLWWWGGEVADLHRDTKSNAACVWNMTCKMAKSISILLKNEKDNVSKISHTGCTLNVSSVPGRGYVAETMQHSPDHTEESEENPSWSLHRITDWQVFFSPSVLIGHAISPHSVADMDMCLPIDMHPKEHMHACAHTHTGVWEVCIQMKKKTLTRNFGPRSFSWPVGHWLSCEWDRDWDCEAHPPPRFIHNGTLILQSSYDRFNHISQDSNWSFPHHLVLRNWGCTTILAVKGPRLQRCRDVVPLWSWHCSVVFPVCTRTQSFLR